MARVRGEFMRLGRGPDSDTGGWVNIPETFHGIFSLEVTGTATVPDADTTADFGGQFDRGHVRLISDADMVVAIGDDPVADPAQQSSYIQAGKELILPIAEGFKLSFITAAGL